MVRTFVDMFYLKEATEYLLFANDSVAYQKT